MLYLMKNKQKTKIIEWEIMSVCCIQALCVREVDCSRLLNTIYFSHKEMSSDNETFKCIKWKIFVYEPAKVHF